MLRTPALLASVALASLAACSHDRPPADPGMKHEQMKMASTCWDRLGGESNVRRVVDDFVGRAASDPKVDFFRKSVPGAEWRPSDRDVARLKQLLVELISSGTGGPLKYTGRSMKETHAGMKITAAQFNALAADLDAALKAGGAADPDRQAVIAFAASTAKDIIEVQ